MHENSGIVESNLNANAVDVQSGGEAQSLIYRDIRISVLTQNNIGLAALWYRSWCKTLALQQNDINIEANVGLATE